MRIEGWNTVYIKYNDPRLVAYIGTNTKTIKEHFSNEFNPSVGDSVSIHMDLAISDTPFYIFDAKVVSKSITYDERGSILHVSYELEYNDAQSYS